MVERSDESFMKRWSRRKQVATEDDPNTLEIAEKTAPLSEPELSEAAQGGGADLNPGNLHQQAEVADTGATSDSEELEPLLTDEDMPSLDTITADSDVSPFFNRGVSGTLRKAALKRLFGLPSFNIRDGLNDYDEDYTQFEPLGDIVTSDMRFQAERKARLAAQAEEDAKLAETSEAADNTLNENEVSAQQAQKEAPSEPSQKDDDTYVEAGDNEALVDSDAGQQTALSDAANEPLVNGESLAAADKQDGVDRQNSRTPV